jgi:hypothetical protein
MKFEKTKAFKYLGSILKEDNSMEQEIQERIAAGNRAYFATKIMFTSKQISRLWRLAAALPPRRPGFDPGSVHVGFVVDKVALAQVFLRVLRFSPVNFIPPVLHY